VHPGVRRERGTHRSAGGRSPGLGFAEVRQQRPLGSRRHPDRGPGSLCRGGGPHDGALNGLARHRVNRELMARNWDDLLRVAGSSARGTISASELIGSLVRSSRPSTLTRAIGELGRVANLADISAVSRSDGDSCPSYDLGPEQDEPHARRRAGEPDPQVVPAGNDVVGGVQGDQHIKEAVKEVVPVHRAA
jgi:hypothetical protein